MKNTFTNLSSTPLAEIDCFDISEKNVRFTLEKEESQNEGAVVYMINWHNVESPHMYLKINECDNFSELRKRLYKLTFKYGHEVINQRILMQGYQIVSLEHAKALEKIYNALIDHIETVGGTLFNMHCERHTGEDEKEEYYYG